MYFFGMLGCQSSELTNQNIYHSRVEFSESGDFSVLERTVLLINYTWAEGGKSARGGFNKELRLVLS